MANTTITALPAATTPLTGTEVVPIVQSGVTKKVAVSAIGGGGSGTVTSVSVATANGLAGSVATSTTTPATDFKEVLRQESFRMPKTRSPNFSKRL
jgi:hypothetical protein